MSRASRACCWALSWACLQGCGSSEPWTICREPLLDRAIQSGLPALVVDIDDTVTDGGFWYSVRLFLGIFPYDAPQLAGASETLAALSERYSIMFLTARDDFVDGRTLEWLDRNGFPRAPVIFSSSVLLGHEAKADYKSATIRELRRRGMDRRGTSYGIGDKASDIIAYSRSSMRSILVLESVEDPDRTETVEALRAVPWPSGSVAEFAPHRTTTDWNTAWQEIGVALMSVAEARRTDSAPPTAAAAGVDVKATPPGYRRAPEPEPGA